MLLFLGDSCPLGWELEQELLAPMPDDYDTSNIYYQGMDFPIEPLFRADKAYPQLISTELGQPFWNLGIGGGSYDLILRNFQNFLKTHEITQHTTVFLSCVSFYRRLMYDSFNSQFYTFFPTPQGLVDPPQMCHDSEELLMRTAPSHAVQQINHIYEICKSRNWNFVFHGVGFFISDEELDAIDRFCEIPEELRVPELWQVNWPGMLDEKLWYGCHPSVKGHRQIANTLIAHYNERFI